MRKEGGWQWYHSISLALSYSRCDFQTNRGKYQPVRDIKQLSEPYFYYLQTIIVSQRRKKNCWRYLNFADFLEAGDNTHLWCAVSQVFVKVWRIFKAASPMIAMTLK
jgi:hypothetical protein